MARRLALDPIRYQQHYKMFKQQQQNFWTTEELNFTQDVDDWKKMSPALKAVYEPVLALFSILDTKVNENLTSIESRLPSDMLEAKMFICAQKYIESVHIETYSKQLEIIEDMDKRMKLLNATSNWKSVDKLAEVVTLYNREDVDTNELVFASGCSEAIIILPLMAFIFWLRKKNLLPGIRFANELISRDEMLHTTFASTLLKEFPRLSQGKAYEIVRAYVDGVLAFTTEILSDASSELDDLNVDNMKEYAEMVADYYLDMNGYKKLYNASNPFPFMADFSLTEKGNFFEKRISEYKKFSIKNTNTRKVEVDFDLQI